jgi:ABC-type dipeptide/oligopeptide/nickel transport system permease component
LGLSSRNRRADSTGFGTGNRLGLFFRRGGTAISGSVVVEVVFDWPGVGSMFVDSIAMRDFPMIQAIVGLVAVSVIGANLIVDLLYGVVDPRIRIDAASPST